MPSGPEALALKEQFKSLLTLALRRPRPPPPGPRSSVHGWVQGPDSSARAQATSECPLAWPAPSISWLRPCRWTTAEAPRASAGRARLGILLAGLVTGRCRAAGWGHGGGFALAGGAAGRECRAGVLRAGCPLAQPWSVVGGNTLGAGRHCDAAPLHGLVWALGAVVVAVIALMFPAALPAPAGRRVGAFDGLDGHHGLGLCGAAGGLQLATAGAGGHGLTTGSAAAAIRTPRSACPWRRAFRQRRPLWRGRARRRAVPLQPGADVPRDDLAELLHEAELLGYRNRMQVLRCSEVMTQPVITVVYGTSLEEAWDPLQQHQIKALPVVDRVQRIVGIVTRSDFLRAAEAGQHLGLAARLQSLLAKHDHAPDKPGSGGPDHDAPRARGQPRPARQRGAALLRRQRPPPPAHRRRAKPGSSASPPRPTS